MRENNELSRRRRRLYANTPKPNDNVTIPVVNKILTETVFRETESDIFPDNPKRIRVNSVAAETVALVSTSVEMTGLSVNR